MSKKYGYDLCDKPEEPKYMTISSCGSARPAGDYEICHGNVRVFLKRIIEDFNKYGKHYDRMSQSPIALKQNDNVTGVRLEKRTFSNYNF